MTPAEKERRRAELVYRGNQWVWWRASVEGFRTVHGESLRLQRAREVERLIGQVVGVLAGEIERQAAAAKKASTDRSQQQGGKKWFCS